MNICLVLHNIRSIYNVGAILRTAEGLGVRQVVYSGYTPRYDDPDLLPHLRDKLNRQIAKAALGAERIVDQESVANLDEWLSHRQGPVIGLENNLAAQELKRKIILGSPRQAETLPIELFKPPRRSRLKGEIDICPVLPESWPVLILGEEVHGIPAELRQYCDYFLEIPMNGRKESFNVSVATGIALWGLKHG